LQELDKMLWQYEAESFIPHEIWETEKAVTDIDEIKTLKIVLLWTDCFIKRSHFGK
ncbi:DNA polymerase III subunit chi, partial [Neisseria gonorrhoeae]